MACGFERVRLPFWGGLMKKFKIKEVICPACEGTGFPKVKQPVPPGVKIYPAPCENCAGKGRIVAEKLSSTIKGKK